MTLLLFILYPAAFVIALMYIFLGIAEKKWGQLFFAIVFLCWLTWPFPLILIHGGF